MINETDMTDPFTFSLTLPVAGCKLKHEWIKYSDWIKIITVALGEDSLDLHAFLITSLRLEYMYYIPGHCILFIY